jgi:hypothetical protein
VRARILAQICRFGRAARRRRGATWLSHWPERAPDGLIFAAGGLRMHCFMPAAPARQTR